jgi:hypothetical protein
MDFYKTTRVATILLRRISLLLVILSGLINSYNGYSQPLGNEWIDFSKTYYKIPITTVTPPHSMASNQADKGDYSQFYRINYSLLDSLNLLNVPAQDFQLWRNGKEVPLYITKADGPLTPTDYIEFWGEPNDGKMDKQLYYDSTYQYNDRWSLFSDTSIHFLTVNPGGNNARITDTITNPLASNLPLDNYFMHTIKINLKQFFYGGYARTIGEQPVRSSSFDQGEGWGALIPYYSSLSCNFDPTLLYEYPSGPLSSIKYAISGESSQTRNISVVLQNSSKPIGQRDTLIDTKNFLNFTPASYTVKNIPYSAITAKTAGAIRLIFKYTNPAVPEYDAIYVLGAELSYARTFNFSKSTTASEDRFLFTLPASPTGNLFNVNAPRLDGFTPLIIDLTNKKRYVGVRVNPNQDLYAFEIGPSAAERKLVFVGGNTLNVHFKNLYDALPGFTNRVPKPFKFRDYSKAESQGNYAIITNTKHFTFEGTDFIEKYQEYRNSKAGGSFKAIVCEIDSLTDQFAYGIKRSPLAIRNFGKYAKAKFSEELNNIFIIGRGITYDSYSQSLGYAQGGNLITNPQTDMLGIVPTWGSPASDNMLVAADGNKSTVPTIPIGRLGAINGKEVKNYLEKVKEYELLQSSVETASWQKNAIHLVGGSRPAVRDYVIPRMAEYKSILEDTLAGATVNTYVRQNSPTTAADNFAIQKRINDGTGLLTYYGESSPTSIDFSINEPNELSNTGGKYPVFLFNGCNASQFYGLSDLRISGDRLTVSEKFVLAKERGTIAFMSSSHFGILQYLAPFTKEWYKSAGRSKYGKGLGEILQNAIYNTNNGGYWQQNDYYNRLTTEEFILHGDPAVKLYSILLPDYAVDSTSITFSPAHVTMATDSITVNTTLYNLGKAVGDSVMLTLTRTLPDGKVQEILKKKIPGFGYSKTITVKVPIVGINEKGENLFSATLDSLDEIEEENKDNNRYTQSLFIYDNEVSPILPYQYAILGDLTKPVKFTGSTVNPLADNIEYRLEIDSTIRFNSPLLKYKHTTVGGGLVEFEVDLSDLPDSTVYYWRMSPITAGVASNWTNSSFTYLSGSGQGFNQSHYYQHLKSTYQNLRLDTLSRQFVYDSTYNHLYIDHGIWGTSAIEESQLSVTANGLLLTRSTCTGWSIIFNLFDSLNFKPVRNYPGGAFGSSNTTCDNVEFTRQYNFEFSYFPSSNRKKIMDFLDSIPKGTFVTARLIVAPDPGQPSFGLGKADSSFSKNWQRDTILFGSGKSLYHSLLRQGFKNLNELDAPKTFAFVFKKDDTLSFKPQYKLSDGLYDRVIMSVPLPMQDTGGIVTSPIFGPASEWSQLHWNNKPLVNPTYDDGKTDSVQIIVYGIDTAGVEKKLKQFGKTVKDTSIADIDAAKYPYLKLQMINNDPMLGTPHQLDYWRLNFSPLPEGAIVPSEYYNFTKNHFTGTFKDTLDKGVDTLHFGIAFKNISTTNFKDSIAVEVKLTDSAGKETFIPIDAIKPLWVNDTAHVDIEMLTDQLEGAYTLFINFNPNKKQPEELVSNNFMYKAFYVNAFPDGSVDSVSYFEFTRNSANDFKDTLTIGKDPLNFGIAFKNISPFAFTDSIVANISIQKDGQQADIVSTQKLKPLLPNDTLHLSYSSSTETQTEGWYTISSIFNPNTVQKEKTFSNNTFSRKFYLENQKDTASFFSFTATLQGDSVLLNWTSTNEINYASYTVEYSIDNQTFRSLESFESQHSNTAASYDYVHKDPVPDTNFYRIRITRNNGSILYSVIRKIYIPTAPRPTEFKVRVVPNPFRDKLIVNIENPNTTAVPAILVNVSGQVVKRLNLQAHNEVNTSMLPAGTYWLIIYRDKEKILIKVEKL